MIPYSMLENLPNFPLERSHGKRPISRNMQSNESGITMFCSNNFKEVDVFPCSINCIPTGCFGISGAYLHMSLIFMRNAGPAGQPRNGRGAAVSSAGWRSHNHGGMP